MKRTSRTVVRQLVWLGGIAGVAVLAWASWEPSDTQAPPPLDPPAVRASGAPIQGDQPGALATPTTSQPVRKDSPAPSAAVAWARDGTAAALPELSRIQSRVRQALSSDKPGLAGPAAQSIHGCLSWELLAPTMRALAGDRQREKPKADYGEFVAFMDQFHATCQGLDAATRVQLEPLARRSLQEGDRGAAALLVWHLDKAFDPVRETDVVTALKRDAWACDLDSVAALDSLSDRHPQLLTGSEWAAIGRLARSRPMLGRAWRPLQIASTPSADAFAAEVDGIIAFVQASCVKDGQRP